MAETHLTSTVLDLTNQYNLHLTFWRWLGVQHGDYDHAYVRLSTDGVNWVDLWTNERRVVDGEWVEIDYDISAWAEDQATVYLRWTMGTTDGGWEYCGWNIDDIQVWAHEGMNTYTAVHNEPASVVSILRLDPVHPNPFNPSTNIRFHLPGSGRVNLSVFDVSGRLVTTLEDGNLDAGTHSTSWDGRDLQGTEVGPGVYFLRLEADRSIVSRKMVLVK